jgi:hypothetical protein
MKRLRIGPLEAGVDLRDPSDCDRRTTIRIVRLDVERQGPVLTFDIEATAFLKNMVRIVVGTLVDVDRGRLERRRDRGHASDRRAKRRRHDRPAAGLDATARDLLTNPAIWWIDVGPLPSMILVCRRRGSR